MNLIMAVVTVTALALGATTTKMDVCFPQRVACFRVVRMLLDTKKQLANQVTVDALVPTPQASMPLPDHVQPLHANEVEFH